MRLCIKKTSSRRLTSNEESERSNKKRDGRERPKVAYTLRGAQSLMYCLERQSCRLERCRESSYLFIAEPTDNSWTRTPLGMFRNGGTGEEKKSWWTQVFL